MAMADKDSSIILPSGTLSTCTHQAFAFDTGDWPSINTILYHVYCSSQQVTCMHGKLFEQTVYSYINWWVDVSLDAYAEPSHLHHGA